MVKKTNPRLGFTIVEILVVVAILGVLSSASVPFAEFTFIREKEGEFKNNLADIRKAIGRWRRDAEKAVQKSPWGLYGVMGVDEPAFFPPDIASLSKTEPFPIIVYDPKTRAVLGTVKFYHDRYMSAIPIDPFVGRALWTQHYASGSATTTYDMGSTSPPPGANVGVFDVTGHPDPKERRGFVTAIDGTKYSDW